MRTAAGERGYRTIIPIDTGIVAQGAGAVTQIPLDKLPIEKNGMKVNVLGFRLLFPTATFRMVQNKSVDGVSLSQLIARLTIKLADGAPPSEFNGGEFLVKDCDGFRALDALHSRAKVPVIKGWGQDMIALVAPAAAVLTPLALTTAQIHRRFGWLQFQGPFGTSTGAADDFSAVVAFYLPVGEKDGEKLGSVAIPAEWFVGKRGDGKGCQGAPGTAGYIEVIQGSKVDNATVTYTAASPFQLFAEVFLTPAHRRPCPTTPRIRVGSFSASQNAFEPHIREQLWLRKPLTSAGATQTHDYTYVRVSCAGYQINHENATYQLNHLMGEERGFENSMFGFADAETSFSTAGATRHTRSGMPLLYNPGSVLEIPGSITDPTVVEIITTGETAPYAYIDVGATPLTAAVRARAEKWCGDGMVCIPRTANGNDLPVWTGAEEILPGELVARDPAAPAPKQ